MADLVAWFFGLISLAQAVWMLMEWWAKKGQYKHLRATRDDVRALREMCKKLNGQGLFRTEAERAWVIQLDYQLRSIENQIGAVMGGSWAPKQ